MPKRRLKIIIPATVIAAATPAAFGICHFFDQGSIAPKITANSTEWVKKATVSIESAASFTSDTLDHYEYCISDNSSSKNCAWRSTTDSQISIINAGTSYVRFRGISSRNFITAESNTVKVLIDRTKPEAEASVDTDENSISITIDASDELSGIESYYYSLDGTEYLEGSQTYHFSDLVAGSSHNVKIKITDKAGNTRYLTSTYNLEEQTTTSRKNNSTTSSRKKTSLVSNKSNTDATSSVKNNKSPSQNIKEKASHSKTETTEKIATETSSTINPKSTTTTYVIGYDLDDGAFLEDSIAPAEFTPGSQINIETPEKDGYIFAGWLCEIIDTKPFFDSITIPASIDNDLTFTAIWTPVVNEPEEEKETVGETAEDTEDPENSTKDTSDPAEEVEDIVPSSERSQVDELSNNEPINESAIEASSNAAEAEEEQ